jgi:outer membrane immunogenic protein
MLSQLFVSRISLTKVFSAAAILAIGLTGVRAADLAPSYTKAPAMAPAWNWSGFYIGADVGGVAQTASGLSDFFQSGIGSGSAANLQSQSLSPSGVIGGVHVGYNWQLSQWVLGVEGDWQWTGAKSSFCRPTDNLDLPCVNDSGRGFLTIDSETRSIGTIRGRLGYAFDHVLVYGTGGVAFVDQHDSITANCPAGCGADNTANVSTANFSAVKTGWVAGAGIEWMLSPNWILRSEYLHVDAGTVASTFNFDPVNCNAGGPCGASWSHDNRYDIGRVGLSYKFGG